MNLAARVAKLEARHRIDVTKVLGVSVDGTPMWREVMRDGVLHCLPRYEHDEWAERCRTQQAELQEQLRGFAALLGEEDPQDDAPGIVGTPAPLKPGQKVRKFIHLPDGTEIQLKRT